MDMYKLLQHSFVDLQISELKLFIADDQPRILERLKSFIAEFPDMRLVGEAETTLQTIRGIWATKPEVVLLDIRMPGDGGLHVLSKIKLHKPAPLVIIFTGRPESYYRELCLDLGADYFFNKSEFDQVEVLLRQLQSAKQAWIKAPKDSFPKDINEE